MKHHKNDQRKDTAKINPWKAVKQARKKLKGESKAIFQLKMSIFRGAGRPSHRNYVIR